MPESIDPAHYPVLERCIPGKLGTNINVVRNLRQSLCEEGVDFIRHKKKLRHTEASVEKINTALLTPDPVESAEEAEGAPEKSASAPESPVIVEEAQALILAQKKAPREAVAQVIRTGHRNSRVVTAIIQGEGDPKKPADWVTVFVGNSRTIPLRSRDGSPFLLPVRFRNGAAWDLIGQPPAKTGDWCGRAHPLLTQSQA